MDKKILAKNKKAYFNYSVLDTLECGIVLQGSEVKSIKANTFSFADSYVVFKKEEMILNSFHITKYKFGNIFNHEEMREKKLLAHKKEILKLKKKTEMKGLTIIPLLVYLKYGRVKIEIGLCKGKKQHDKREDLKKRDLDREVSKNFKNKLK